MHPSLFRNVTTHVQNTAYYDTQQQQKTKKKLYACLLRFFVDPLHKQTNKQTRAEEVGVGATTTTRRDVFIVVMCLW